MSDGGVLSKTLKVGLVGLGKMGGIRYRELLKHPHTTVTHGADTNAELYEAYPGVKCSADPQDVIIYFDIDPSWELEIKDFVDSILNDTPTTSGTSDDALKAMQMVYAIYNSDEKFLQTGNRFRDSLREE